MASAWIEDEPPLKLSSLEASSKRLFVANDPRRYRLDGTSSIVDCVNRRVRRLNYRLKPYAIPRRARSTHSVGGHTEKSFLLTGETNMCIAWRFMPCQ